MKIDTHVHLVGNGSSGSGCWLKLGGRHSLFARYMLYHLGLPQDSLTADLDRIYVARLLQMVRESSLDKVVILAHENPYDEKGRLIEGVATLYVPNSYVLGLAKQHPEFLPAVSIHPGRPDAMEELESCIEGGAVMMKCLPNCQNFNCSNKSFRPFWERMAKAGVILLAHTGGEFSLPVINKMFADPQFLELPLECGVTVIAAHSGTSSGPFDTNYIPTIVRMIDRYPNLYVDNSALNSPLRSMHLRSVLEEQILSRVVHGSDLPIPVSGRWPYLRGLIRRDDFLRWESDPNILERDYQLKVASGFPPESFTRLSGLLKR